jgi:hypothetical protein
MHQGAKKIFILQRKVLEDLEKYKVAFNLFLRTKKCI